MHVGSGEHRYVRNQGQFAVLTTDGAGVAAISILDKKHCYWAKGPSNIYVSTLGYLVGQQNANLVNRPDLLKMLTRVFTWSKMGKIVLT